ALLEAAKLSETCLDTPLVFNVNSVAIQVPHSDLTHGGDGSEVVGSWTTAARRSVRIQYSDGHQAFSGKFVQVSRLGMPLVNEVVIPLGSKDLFNASQPKDDAQFAPKVQTWGQDPNDLPALINAIYGIDIPDCDNDPSNGIDRTCDLFPVFLQGLPGLNQPPVVQASEMLRLNTPVRTWTCSPRKAHLNGGGTRPPGSPRPSPRLGDPTEAARRTFSDALATRKGRWTVRRTIRVAAVAGLSAAMFGAGSLGIILRGG